MGRRPCCVKEGLKRGAWSPQEDRILVHYINAHGEGKWRDLPARAGLKRCGKSCRLRWLNYLNPNIKRGNISLDEEDLIVRLHNLLGNRWSLIAGRLPGRTDNEIKNYWNTCLIKKLKPDAPPRQPSSGKDDECAGAATMMDRPHQVIRTKAVRCNKVYPAHGAAFGHAGTTEAKPHTALMPTAPTMASVLLQESDPSMYLVDFSDQEQLLRAGVDHDLFIHGWLSDIKNYGGDANEGDCGTCDMLPDQLDEDAMEEWRRTCAFHTNF